MSDSGSNATERQKRAFGLLLRRLSENAGLTQDQNVMRDRLYQMAAAGEYEQAFDINHQLLLEVGNGHCDTPKTVELPQNLLSRFFKRRQITDPDIPHVFQSRERQLTTLALDRAVLLGMSGQPGEANALLDKLMDARGEDPGNHMAEDIFDAALGLADLADNQGRRQQILRARMQFYFDLALELGDEEKLETTLQALESLYPEVLDVEDVSQVMDATRCKADMLRKFGQLHEKTGLLKSAAKLLNDLALTIRKNGHIKDSYNLVLEALEAEIALASLMSDTSELSSLSNRLRDIVDLPDTMISNEARGQARHILGTSLARQAEIDGRIVTLRKAFGYFESAAKLYAEIGQEAKELQCLRDLALAKLTAAELLALDAQNTDTDLVLAQRYNAEAMLLQQQLSARIG